VGASKVTLSACTFDRKITIVSSAKLPAPSVARPMIVMNPPAPEVGGNEMCSLWLKVVTAEVKMLSDWRCWGPNR